MAELPSNLDDAKQWVPADILPDEMTYMEELAQQLSSYTLCEPPQQQTQTKTKTKTKTKIVANANTKPVIPQAKPNQNKFGSVHHGTGVGVGVVHSVYASDCSGYRVMPPVPGYQFPPVIGTTTQTSNSGRVLQNQQIGNCFFPFQANVGGAGGFVKGTGVFLPRVDPLETTRRPQQGDENYYFKVPVKRNPKRNSAEKKEVVGMKATAELGLPQEWTY